MADAKLFTRSKLQELKAELQADKKDKNFVKRKTVLKRVVASMTMGQDMSPLYPEILACLSIQVLEIKKMVYLYLVNYARVKPEMVKHALPGLLSDANDANALIRALAIRTMSYIAVPEVVRALLEPLHHSLKDRDPYVRKTACIAVAKLYMHDRRIVEKEDYISNLRDLLMDHNPTVIANAVASLVEISERSDNITLRLNGDIARRLVRAMSEASEWGQTYILESLMYYVPEEHEDAELLAEQISARLQHSNSAVVLTTVKVILYLMNYMGSQVIVHEMCRKLSPPLVTLLSSGYEVQYVALRNIYLIIQRRPSVLRNDVKVFFCKYNDPIYVKLAKLEIIYRLANEKNVEQVLAELKEYASEVDVEFVRKSVRTIGRLAIKINSSADICISVLLQLVSTKISYVVQEAIVVIKDIFRRYPNQYEGIIGTLCENLDLLDMNPDAKASMIWILGQYADRIENSEELLDDFLQSFLEETVEVQLALLTATVKLFIKRPTAGQALVPKVLKWATESVDNPDLRDRGYIYWRLLSTDPAAAQGIVLSEKPRISTESEAMDRGVLDRLLLHTGTLASIYGREPQTFVRGVRTRVLQDSPALSQEAKESYLESLRLPKLSVPFLSSTQSSQPTESMAYLGSQSQLERSTSSGGPPVVPPKPLRQDSDLGGDYGLGGTARGTGGGGGGGAANLLGEEEDSDEEEEGTALNPAALSSQERNDGVTGRNGDITGGVEDGDGGEALDPYASLARMSMDDWGLASRGGQGGITTGYEMDESNAMVRRDGGNGKGVDDLLL